MKFIQYHSTRNMRNSTMSSGALTVHPKSLLQSLNGCTGSYIKCDLSVKPKSCGWTRLAYTCGCVYQYTPKILSIALH